MKALVTCAILLASVVAQAQDKAALEQKATAAYAAREYSAAGIVKAQEAADAYSQLAGFENDAKKRAKFEISQSEALYFAGNASEQKTAKIKFHLAGIDAADKALFSYGIADVASTKAADLKKNLTPEEIVLVAEALYNRGINLGQWGQANGITESLGRWPELRATMQLIIALGQSKIHDYGANRVIGRGYHQVPGLFGGDNKKAETNLKAAFENTKAAGTNISVNATNTIYWAELLHDTNREDEAVKILEELVKADGKAIGAAAGPEFAKGQEDAKVLLKKW